MCSVTKVASCWSLTHTNNVHDISITLKAIGQEKIVNIKKRTEEKKYEQQTCKKMTERR